MSVGPQHPFGGMPRRGLAIGSMFLAAFMFSVMTLATKMLGNAAWTRPLPTAEITLARFAFGALVMLPLLAYKPARLLGLDRLGLFWRGLSGGLAVYTYFLAIQHTALTNAVLLNLTSVIFAPLCAAIVLREPIERRAMVGMVLAATGILLITRPETGAFRLGDAYGLLSGLLAGFALTAVRRLRQQETASAVFFYFSVVGVPVALVGGIGTGFVIPDGRGWLLLLLMAASSVCAQILMTYGYRYIRTADGVLMTLSQLAYSAAAGAIVFGERITPAIIMGAVFVLVAGGIVSTAGGKVRA